MTGPLGKIAPDTSNPHSQECVRWASKATYLLYHHITPEDEQRILAAYGIDKTTGHEFASAARRMKEFRAQFENEVFVGYVYPIVGLIIVAWTELEESHDRQLQMIAAAERESLWHGQFDANPECVASKMWRVGAEVLPLHTIYGESTEFTQDDKAKLAAVRTMLRSKFVFTCEESYKHRYLQDPRTTPLKYASYPDAQCFSNWAKYSDIPGFRQTIVPYEHLPVTTAIPGSRTK